jgi:hypothetical protein
MPSLADRLYEAGKKKRLSDRLYESRNKTPLADRLAEAAQPLSITREQINALPGREDVDKRSVGTGGDFNVPRHDISTGRSMVNDIARGGGVIASGLAGNVDAFNKFALGKETQHGPSVQRAVEEFAPVNPETTETFLGGSLMRGVGTYGMLALPGAALSTTVGRGAAIAGTAAIGGLAGTGQAFQEGTAAQKAGKPVSDADVVGAMIAYGLLNASDAIPIFTMISRYKTGTGSLWRLLKDLPEDIARDPVTFKQTIKEALKGAGEESLQETGQTIGENITSRELLADADRGTFQGVGEAAAVGGIIGGVASGVGAANQAVKDSGRLPTKPSQLERESLQALGVTDEKAMPEVLDNLRKIAAAGGTPEEIKQRQTEYLDTISAPLTTIPSAVENITVPSPPTLEAPPEFFKEPESLTPPPVAPAEPVAVPPPAPPPPAPAPASPPPESVPLTPLAKEAQKLEKQKKVTESAAEEAVASDLANEVVEERGPAVLETAAPKPLLPEELTSRLDELNTAYTETLGRWRNLSLQHRHAVQSGSTQQAERLLAEKEVEREVLNGIVKERQSVRMAIHDIERPAIDIVEEEPPADVILGALEDEVKTPVGVKDLEDRIATLTQQREDLENVPFISASDLMSLDIQIAEATNHLDIAKDAELRAAKKATEKRVSIYRPGEEKVLGEVHPRVREAFESGQETVSVVKPEDAQVGDIRDIKVEKGVGVEDEVSIPGEDVKVKILAVNKKRFNPKTGKLKKPSKAMKLWVVDDPEADDRKMTHKQAVEAATDLAVRKANRKYLDEFKSLQEKVAALPPLTKEQKKARKEFAKKKKEFEEKRAEHQKQKDALAAKAQRLSSRMTKNEKARKELKAEIEEAKGVLPKEEVAEMEATLAVLEGESERLQRLFLEVGEPEVEAPQEEDAPTQPLGEDEAQELADLLGPKPKQAPLPEKKEPPAKKPLPVPAGRETPPKSPPAAVAPETPPVPVEEAVEPPAPPIAPEAPVEEEVSPAKVEVEVEAAVHEVTTAAEEATDKALELQGKEKEHPVLQEDRANGFNPDDVTVSIQGPEKQHEIAQWLGMPTLALNQIRGAREAALDLINAPQHYSREIHYDRQKVRELLREIGPFRQYFPWVRRKVDEGIKFLEAKDSEGWAKYKIENPRLARVAEGVQQIYRDFLVDIKAYKRLMLELEAEPEEMAAFKAVVDSGAEITLVSDAFGANPDIVAEMVEDYQKIEEFGLQDYFTHIEGGTFLVRGIVENEDGTSSSIVRAVGRTPNLARRKIAALAKETGITEWVIEPEFKYDALMGLSRKDARAVKRQTAINARKFSEELNEVLHLSGSSVTVEPDFIAKAMTQQLDKKRMKGVFAPPLLHRGNILKGEADPFQALRVYSYVMRKKMALDPVHTAVMKDINKGSYPTWVNNILLDQIAANRGKHTVWNDFVDGLFWQEIGPKDGPVKRTLKKALMNVALNTRPQKADRYIFRPLKTLGSIPLWYNPISMVANKLAGEMATVVMAGPSHYVRGRLLARTPGGKAAFREWEYALGEKSSVDLGRDIATERDWKLLLRPLGIHTLPERSIRKNGFFANYSYWLDKGFSPKKAAREAVRSTGFQQRIFVLSAIPKLLRNPLAGVSLQFKGHIGATIQMLHAQPHKIIPYLTAMTVLGGPKALIATIRSIPFLVPALAILPYIDKDAPEEMMAWLDKNFPNAARGLGGLPAKIPKIGQFEVPGIDISGVIAPLLQTGGPEVLMGVFIGTLVRTFQEMKNDVAVSKIRYPENFDFEKPVDSPFYKDEIWIKQMEKNIRQIRGWDDLWSYYKAHDGTVRETDRLFFPTGKGKIESTLADDWNVWGGIKAFGLAAGVQYTDIVVDRAVDYRIDKDRQEQDQARNKVGKRFVRAILKNDKKYQEEHLARDVVSLMIGPNGEELDVEGRIKALLIHEFPDITPENRRLVLNKVREIVGRRQFHPNF